MPFSKLQSEINELAREFAAQRRERQQRLHLDRGDFQRLHEIGYTRVAVPVSAGGLWSGVPNTVRGICQALRTLAGGDSSVALVSAMHPAVLSYWLAAPASAANEPLWKEQCDRMTDSVRAGEWWGTITSEPGTGGDVSKSAAQATPGDAPLDYRLTGLKHFGSGTGVMSYMVTAAVPEGEAQPDWFFVDVRDTELDGSAGLQLVSEWDGQGMKATQSHSLKFDSFPATRIAWPGHLGEVSGRAGGLIGCMFTSVVVGIVEVAVATASELLAGRSLVSYDEVEWTRCRMEAWTIGQILEGMIRTVESEWDPRLPVLQGKTMIAELSETLLGRLCRIMGGSTFSRRSPFGHWYEDVRALGFLRPPWSLAYQNLINGFPELPQ